MIKDYVVQWDLKDIIDNSFDVEDVKLNVYKNIFPMLAGTFKFSFQGIHYWENNTSMLVFEKETDWKFESQDRTFNLFYGYEIKDLGLVVIYKDKSEGIEIKENHLYCIPYWMTYKFMSKDENKTQQVVNAKFLTDDRPINKLNHIKW